MSVVPVEGKAAAPLAFEEEPEPGSPSLSIGDLSDHEIVELLQAASESAVDGEMQPGGQADPLLALWDVLASWDVDGVSGRLQATDMADAAAFLGSNVLEEGRAEGARELDFSGGTRGERQLIKLELVAVRQARAAVQVASALGGSAIRAAAGRKG